MPKAQSLVAGFVELATVTSEGVRIERVREWPDAVCQPHLPARPGAGRAGGRAAVEAEEMLFRHIDPADLANRVITIDSPINNVHLPSIHNSIYPPATPDDVSNGVTLTVIVAAGVTVGSNHTAQLAFDMGVGNDWPAGFQITLQVLGRIQGAGGNAGAAANGAAGGTALWSRMNFTLDNQGQIWGGAGGGGGVANCGGGGGQGKVPGLGSSGLDAPGQNGTPDAPGAGGTFDQSHGGDGGAAGEAGDPGTAGGQELTSGGAPGNAIDGNAFVVGVVNFGDVRGPVIN